MTMRKLVIFLCLFLSLQTVNAQLTEKWMGDYIGTLTSTNLEGKTADFHMELHIAMNEDSTYNFTIVYGKDEQRQERAYLLIPSGKNKFVLDEKNGILLDMSLGPDRLTSVFEVQGSLLHVSYILEKKGIRFELTSSTEGAITGGNVSEDQEIPSVTSYKTTSYQSAFLKRQK